MRVVFMGTPDISAVCLERILDDGFDVTAVYTKPDAPRNRGMKMEQSPVKKLALARGIPVYQPAGFRDPAVVEELRSMKLKEAARKVEDGIEETLTYCDFPSEHWTRIRTNNVIERLNREIRRRTRVVGSFPDGNSALMLVCARLRHVAGTQWGNKKYMNMKHLEAAVEDASIAG